MRKKEESGNGLILSTYEQNKHDANSTIKELSCCRRYKSKVLRSVVSRLNCPKRSEPHSFGRAGVNGSVTGPEAQNPKLVAQKPHHLNPPQSAACTCPLWCKQVFAPVSLVRRWASKGPPFHHPNLCSRPSCVLVSFAISCIFPSVVLVVSVPEAACVFFLCGELHLTPPLSNKVVVIAPATRSETRQTPSARYRLLSYNHRLNLFPHPESFPYEHLTWPVLAPCVVNRLYSESKYEKFMPLPPSHLITQTTFSKPLFQP